MGGRAPCGALVGDLEVLARADDHRGDRRAGGGDVAVAAARVVRRRIDRHAEEVEPVGSGGADRPGVLADATGEGEDVEPAEGGSHRGDLTPQPVDVNVHGERRLAVPAVAGSEHGAHVAVRPAQRGEATALLQTVGHVVDLDAGGGLQPKHQPRVNRAGARGHHESLERREPHRRVHRRAVGDRAQRCPGPEVATDRPRAGDLTAGDGRRPAGDPRMREAVEAVPSSVPSSPPFRRDGVGAGGGGHRRVEPGVEAGDVRRVRHGASRSLDALHRPPLVQRRQRRERVDALDHVVGHDLWTGELRPAVDDAVTDGVDTDGARDEGFDIGAGVVAGPLIELAVGDDLVVLVDDRQLERRRSGVDDEDRHQPGQTQSRTSGRSSPV
jgi:hypothetical protein